MQDNQQPLGMRASSIALKIVAVALACFAHSGCYGPDVSELVTAIRQADRPEARRLIKTGVWRSLYGSEPQHLRHDLGFGYIESRGHSCECVHIAAAEGRPLILRDLLNAGADPNSPDSKDRTPIMWIAMRYSSEISPEQLACLSILVTKGANINADSEYVSPPGMTALHMAIDGGHTQLVNHLIALGADVTVRRDDGNTPLHQACATSEVDTYSIASVLLKSGADISSRNRDGHTPLDLARGNNQTRLIELIEDAADASMEQRQGG